jgi:putative phosphoribosyl transferase
METSKITIQVSGSIQLEGDLYGPLGSNALVIFAHGSGSSRLSPRNHYVARALNKHKITTLLTDLLTEEEDNVFENRFDIGLLTGRLLSVTNFVSELPYIKRLPIGYFGASTGAASALMAAARLPGLVHGVVSRGGRPDLAGPSLPNVKAPVLLIVGGLDTAVIDLNEKAFGKLKSERELKIVQGATHLFEEPGKMDEVAALAVDWFKKHLVSKAAIS